jgi:uncharacterized membrane protein YjjP (DUF1212 family)
MSGSSINLLAVLAATIARMALGGIWYSPPVFGRTWMALAGRSPEDVRAQMPKALAVDLITSLVMAFVLAQAVRYAGAGNIVQGAAVGFYAWLGFIATTTAGVAVYERRPLRLLQITNGWQVISLVVMGAILAAWP